MPTYTKETALYDTGAIKNGIDGAANTAKSYITNVSNDGIFVHEYSSSDVQPTTTGANGVHISDDVDIIRNGEVVASYGEAAVIGKTTAAHSIIDEDGQRFYASDGTTELAKFTTSGVYLGEDDVVAISPTGATKTVWEEESIGNFSFPATIDLSTSAVYSILPDAQTFYFWFSVNGGETHMFFTKGEAKTSGVGYFYVEYDGESSIIVVSSTTFYTEGDFFIRAQIEKQGGVFSFGHRGVSDDVGFFSATFGEGLLASGDEQAVFGRYNESDSTKAVIIGNGTATSDSINRSNALTVDWNGNVEAQGTISDGGGQLGERILTDDAAASRATGRYFNVASVTLPKGMWIVTCACSFADGTNATGIRRSYITTDAPSGWNNTTTGPASTAIVFYDQVSPLSGNYNSYTRGMGTASITTNTPVTYYLVAYHTAGSAISVTGRINAIRVGTDV